MDPPRVVLDVPNEYHDILLDTVDTPPVPSTPEKRQFMDLHHEVYGYPSVAPLQTFTAESQSYHPYFRRFSLLYSNPPPLEYRNPFVGIAFREVNEAGYRETPYAGRRLTEQATIQLPPPSSARSTSNTIFTFFGNSFPDCRSMIDMFRPRLQVYPGVAENPTPDSVVGSHHEGPRVVNVDITKTWKGLSSDKAQELLFWETTFKRALGYLLHDQFELLEQQHEIKNQAFLEIQREHEQQDKILDGTHYLPVNIIDIATAMVNCWKEHRRMYHWLASMGNIYKTIAQFIRCHDCFVYPPVGNNSCLATGGLRIGVKLLDLGKHSKNTITHTHISGTPVEVNWAPDVLSFEQFDPITTEGHEFRLMPRYNSTLISSGAESDLEPPHIVYKSSASWLRWDASVSSFSGTVPFCSDSKECVVYPDAHLAYGISRDQSETYTLRIMITATALQYFDTNVRFEKTVRARVTINIKSRNCSRTHPDQRYRFERLLSDSQNTKSVPSPLEWRPLQQISPSLERFKNPVMSSTVPFVGFPDETQMLMPISAYEMYSGDRRSLSQQPFDSFIKPSLVVAKVHIDSESKVDEGPSGQRITYSPPGPLEGCLNVPPLRRQRRSPHNIHPLKTAVKLGSTLLPRTSIDLPNHPRTESGDKRLQYDIVNMLGMPTRYDKRDKDLETRYRPRGERCYWRGTNISVQEKGSGDPYQGLHASRNAIFSGANSTEEDELYISKYFQEVGLDSFQRQVSHLTKKSESNLSRVPSSEPLTMNCEPFLNTRRDTRAERLPNLEVPWTPPSSEVCPCGYCPCRFPNGAKVRTERGTDNEAGNASGSSDGDSSSDEGPPLIRGKDKAAFARMLVERAEAERHMLGSDIGDIFDSSPTPTSAGDWEDIDTDEEGVSLPEDGDSEEDGTNQGVAISVV
ncbi:hypothetical protein ACO22_02671 [Paracoccidioides brasiliensis]|uniref:Uncharacterized protein n=1 Tax=Paracoccidioides brasiliensis TaxID=121759 RepID=A0A1D2JI40_PARBR|nr:hypothetical protein ACO22_02671 [Paracoccidioides brasiliensis]